jgi:hypothetical protein
MKASLNIIDRDRRLISAGKRAFAGISEAFAAKEPRQV